MTLPAYFLGSRREMKRCIFTKNSKNENFILKPAMLS